MIQRYGGIAEINSSEQLIIPKMIEQQASCFLVDAENYRSVDHKIDAFGLKVYRFLYSKVWAVVLFISIVGLHCLAFLEFPSSLRLSSFINATFEEPQGFEVGLGATLSLEAIFLLVILLDGISQVYVFGMKSSSKNPWLMGLFVVMFFSWVDFFISVGLKNAYWFRLRRFFRPFFAMQKSQLMKKVLKSLSKTMKDIFSVFVLLLLWLVAFTLISVSLFSGFNGQYIDKQYSSFYDAFFTLLVLLTTANNPDAMVRIYNENRLVFLYFVLFMAVGIFVFMNVLIAIVFNEFRGHVLDSMQASLFRRRVASRAMFEVLKGHQNKLEGDYQNEVDMEVLKAVITNSSICNWRKSEMIKAANSLGSEVVDWNNVKFILGSLDEHKESKMVFPVPKYKGQRQQMFQRFFLSKAFEIIGLVMCFLNIIVIIVDVSIKTEAFIVQAKILNVLNWIFIMFYTTEQLAKFFAMGYKIYFTRQGCFYDFLITLAILVMKVVESVYLSYSLEKSSFVSTNISVWDLARVTNLLILLRAARIVLFFPSLTPIINTLFDIPWRMKSVIGIMLLLFYLYALLGMCIFQNKININFFNSTETIDYQNLHYGGINFNDFYASIVVLWCLLIVNNWHVFMVAFEKAVGTKAAHIYMISWWALSVIVVMNCVTAFVIEAYTQRKAFYEEERIKRLRPKSVSEVFSGSVEYLRSSVVVNNSFTFQMLFKKDLIEPTEEDLLSAMKRCSFLCQQYPHIAHSHYES